MELYLTTNYTLCPKMTSFFGTKEFMTGSEHILTVICVPLNFYCLYLIWFITPKKMEGIKLATLHLQLVSLSFDLIINSLITAVPYLPIPVASFNGLFSYLGIPHTLQFQIAQYNVYLIGMSIINIFQNRHSATTSVPYRFTKTSSLVFYYTLCYLFGAIILSLYFLDDLDNEVLKLEYLQQYPCPPPEYFESSTSVFASVSRVAFCFGTCIVSIVTNALYFALSTVYYLIIVPSSSVSEKTRQMQLRFLIMLTIQLLIPIIGLVVPAVFGFYILYTGSNNQSANNVILLIYCCHGFLSGIALIFIQKPYREYTFQFLIKSSTYEYSIEHLQCPADHTSDSFLTKHQKEYFRRLNAW